MLIDVTQGATVGTLTSNKKGSQTLKVEVDRWLIEFEGEVKEESMKVLSCGIHNIGTHIDMMKPTEINIERFIGEGIKIDISHILDRPVMISDFDISLISKGIYVLFQTNWDRYLGEEKGFYHPEISMEVLEFLVSKKINMVGIDSLGLARGKNHLIFDKYAADHDIYVIENLTKLNEIPVGKFKVYCMPIKIEALDALPARVLVEF